MAGDLFFLAAAHPFVGALDHPFEKLVGFLRIVGQKVVKRVAQGVLDDTLRFDSRQLVLGLADEFRFADEDRQHASRRNHHVFGGDDRGALVLCQLGIGFQALGERNAEARLMRAAFGRGNGVAIGMHDAVATVPGDRPFERTVAAGLFRLAGKDFAGDGEFLAHGRLKIILQSAGEVEHGLFRRFRALDQRRIAGPADFDAAEQIGLGARHAEKPGRVEFGMRPEDFRIGMKFYLGAAPVLDVAQLLQPALRNAA